MIDLIVESPSNKRNCFETKSLSNIRQDDSRLHGTEQNLGLN